MVDLTPKKHHGYAVLIFILGTLLPPLAVAARFGIGRDFWINLFLTLCGYIPGHAHNFYIQNIRNNKTHARTPKWAQRYGLVDTSTIRRKERKSQWATRYNDRLPNSTLEGRPLEDGQDGLENGSSVDMSSESGHPRNQGDLWRPEDEQFYQNKQAGASAASSGRWRYPANFDGADVDYGASKPSKKKKEKKDRWARTEDAYAMPEQSHRKKKKKSKRTTTADSMYSQDDTVTVPEDPEGGVYGNARIKEQPQSTQTTNEEIFNHEF